LNIRAKATYDIKQRVDLIDWDVVSRQLDEEGTARINRLLSADECEALVGLYQNAENFRSRVVMAQHNFGRGEYKYFNYPLPTLVAELRKHAYPHLVPTANRWNRKSPQQEGAFPTKHADFLQQCHAAGQVKPTPLMLRYETDDYNCLHQDLYGENVFPLQLAILLSEPGRDFTGGEFVLTEQRPRMQSRATVVSLAQGDAALFAVNSRPVEGKRGVYTVKLRHGVSRVRSGHRYTLGIIFHDAQ
jgi:hypothetical protein